jgi:hypothetical protein
LLPEVPVGPIPITSPLASLVFPLLTARVATAVEATILRPETVLRSCAREGLLQPLKRHGFLDGSGRSSSVSFIHED